MLACLHGGTREDDAAHLAVAQCRDRHHNREIGLARPRRSNTERHGVAANLGEVVALSERLCAHLLALCRHEQHLGKERVQLLCASRTHETGTVRHLMRRQLCALPVIEEEFLHERASRSDILL